jgi:hypothetical protein
MQPELAAEEPAMAPAVATGHPNGCGNSSRKTFLISRSCTSGHSCYLADTLCHCPHNRWRTACGDDWETVY